MKILTIPLSTNTERFVLKRLFQDLIDNCNQKFFQNKYNNTAQLLTGFYNRIDNKTTNIELDINTAKIIQFSYDLAFQSNYYNGFLGELYRQYIKQILHFLMENKVELNNDNFLVEFINHKLNNKEK